MSEAATVGEALRFYEMYNETARSRTMLGDRSGAAAIDSWQDGRVHIERGTPTSLRWVMRTKPRVAN